jgi:hypothetical protein
LFYKQRKIELFEVIRDSIKIFYYFQSLRPLSSNKFFYLDLFICSENIKIEIIFVFFRLIPSHQYG